MIKAIVGAGGFAREVQAALGMDCKMFVDDEYANESSSIFGLSKFDHLKYEVVVAIGDPVDRMKMVNKLPKNTKFFSFIDPSVLLLGKDISIGEGSIICAGSILTTNIRLGKHTQLNLHTTVGHDVVAGDYFTTAPGVKISGNCTIEDRVYLGTNSSVREKLYICNDVVVGLNSGVVSNIQESGTYVGTPAKKIR